MTVRCRLRSRAAAACIAVTCGSTALARTGDGPLGTQIVDDLLRCRKLGEMQERVLCYDRVTAGLASEAAATDGLDPPADGTAVPMPPSAEAGKRTQADPPAGDTASARAEPSRAPDDEASEGAMAAFGAEDLAKNGRSQVREMRARAVDISRNRIGKYRIELDNGQVWQQVQADTNRLVIRGDEPEVIIKRRSLGYALRLSGSNRSIVVRRVR